MPLTPAMESLSKLRRLPRNPRLHDLGELHTAYTRFGFLQRIIINDVTGRLIAGQGRIDALQQRKVMGKAPPDNVVVSPAGEWLVPADHVEVPEQDEEAAALALNRIGEGLWDDRILTAVLADIAAGPGLDGTGYDADDLDYLLRQQAKLAMREDGGGDPHSFQDNKIAQWRAKWATEVGQVWRIGEHILIIADSTDRRVIDHLLPEQKAHMAWTDPPYNIAYNRPRGDVEEGSGGRTIVGDDQSLIEWHDFVHAFGSILKDHVKGDVYVWGASGPSGMRLRLWLSELGIHWSATIIWVKQHFVLTRGNYHRRFEPLFVGTVDVAEDYEEVLSYEPCFYGWPKGRSSYGVRERVEDDVWQVDRPSISVWHPTTKPVELAVRPILNSSQRGHVVLDLFSGSGTVFLACEKTGRVARAVEIDPGYAAASLERMVVEGSMRPRLVDFIDVSAVTVSEEEETAEAIIPVEV